MPFTDLKKGYPFPGAASKFTMPPGPNDWEPKSWGTTGYTIGLLTALGDFGGSFVDDGVQVGDVIYITSASPPLQLVTFVSQVISNDYLITTYQFLDFFTDVVYKIGMKAPHTLQSLQTIVSARGLYGNTAHWSTIWTQAPFIDFAPDELGDVYVCHDPAEQRMQGLMEDQFFDKDGKPSGSPFDEAETEPVEP